MLNFPFLSFMNRKLKRPKKLVGRWASDRSAFLSLSRMALQELKTWGGRGERSVFGRPEWGRLSFALPPRGVIWSEDRMPTSSPKAKRRKAPCTPVGKAPSTPPGRLQRHHPIPYRRPSAASPGASPKARQDSRWEGPSSITIAGKHKATCQQKGGASSSLPRRAGTLHWGHLQA